MSKATMLAFVLFMALAPSGVRAMSGPAVAPSQSTPAREAWQKEFDNVCSRTQDAMTFSPQELTLLMQRCDALLARIDNLGETQKKVYAGRLRMCRGLYAYVLESKKNEKK